MAGVDLTGFDPWTSVGGAVLGGGGGDKASDLIGTASTVLSGGNPLIGIGMKLLSGALFGGDSSQSGAAGSGQTGLDTSGWVLGHGNATGGNLSGGLPWYGWAALTITAVLLIKGAR